MDDHAVPDLDFRVDHNLRIKHTMISNAAVPAHVRTRFENRSLTDHRSTFNDRKRSHLRVLADPCVGCDDGARVYTTVIFVFLEQPRGGSRKGQFRISNDDGRSSGKFAAADNNASGSAGL